MARSLLSIAPIPLPAPPPLERLRLAAYRFKRSLDDFGHRTVLRAQHARKSAGWDARIADILASPDTALLPRVADAGVVRGRTQVMHNGLLVAKDCYYRWRGTRLFAATQGVHEPQEERVFAEVVKHVGAGGTMIELGAYWAFYSAWFAREIRDARCLLVEPLLANLDLGRHNFRLNHLDGEFVRGFVGSSGSRVGRVPTVCVDDLVEHRGFTQIDILHADIQGFEGEMLQGAERTLRARKVRFAFISTHSEDLHRHCRAELQRHDFELLADIDLASSYSVDGVLVGKLRGTAGPAPITVSRRR